MSGSLKSIGAGGRREWDDDEWWRQTFEDYERQGVPTQLVTLARPMLGAGGSAAAKAHQFLMGEAGSWHESATAQMDLMHLMRSEGFKPLHQRQPTEDELLAAWDDQMGTGRGQPLGGFSLGTSDAASRNPLARGGYSSGPSAR